MIADRKPTGITISTKAGERIGRGDWSLGLRLRRVLFADHRSGWSGVMLHVSLVWRGWQVCVLRWRTPYKPVTPVYSLRQQVRDAHGDPPNEEICKCCGRPADVCDGYCDCPS